jgi:quercetin dioxygenase-like cupin family protein
MEIIRRDEAPVLVNPGVASEQLISPKNSASARLTVTRVVLAPAAVNPRHRHATAEQVWVALAGSGVLLLADAATLPFAAGDVARFAEGDVHGLENTGAGDFVYLAVTSPPLDFRAAYERGAGPAPSE